MRQLSKFLESEHTAGLTEEVLDQVLDKKMRTQKSSQADLPKKVAAVYQSVLERKIN